MNSSLLFLVSICSFYSWILLCLFSFSIADSFFFSISPFPFPCFPFIFSPVTTCSNCYYLSDFLILWKGIHPGGYPSARADALSFPRNDFTDHCEWLFRRRTQLLCWRRLLFELSVISRILFQFWLAACSILLFESGGLENFILDDMFSSSVLWNVFVYSLL